MKERRSGQVWYFMTGHPVLAFGVICGSCALGSAVAVWSHGPNAAWIRFMRQPAIPDSFSSAKYAFLAVVIVVLGIVQLTMAFFKLKRRR